jgi:AAT family amino acid transporter
VLARLNGRGVPVLTVVISTVVMGIGVVVNAVVPEKAFGYITSVSTGGAIVVWTVIVVAHLRYRRRVRAGLLPASAYRMPWAPYSGFAVLAFFAFVTVLIGWQADTRVALYAVAAWFVVVLAGWPAVRGRSGRREAVGGEVAPVAAEG